jgi:hypothetical protein
VIEKRRSRRVNYDLPVDLHRHHSSERLHTVDVSRHGCFLATLDPLPVRHIGKVTVHLPTGSIGAVVQVTRQNVMGMGVSFFALSREAKKLWDAFFSTVSDGTMASHDIEDDAVFVVKLRTMSALKSFVENSYAVGGTYLRTPVLREIGSFLTLTVVHPQTEEEFHIRGQIVRLRVKPPKGMELKFETSAEQAKDFTTFVETGHRPVRERPKPSVDETHPPLSATEEDDDTDLFDIDVVEPSEEELDIEELFDWDEVDDDLLIDPTVWTSLEGDAANSGETPVAPGPRSREDIPVDEENFPPIAAGEDDDERTGTGTAKRRRKEKRKKRKERRKADRRGERVEASEKAR